MTGWLSFLCIVCRSSCHLAPLSPVFCASSFIWLVLAAPDLLAKNDDNGPTYETYLMDEGYVGPDQVGRIGCFWHRRMLPREKRKKIRQRKGQSQAFLREQRKSMCEKEIHSQKSGAGLPYMSWREQVGELMIVIMFRNFLHLFADARNHSSRGYTLCIV